MSTTETTPKTPSDATLLRDSLTLDIMTRPPRMETKQGEDAQKKIEKLWEEFHVQAIRIVVDLERAETLAAYGAQNDENEGDKL